MQEEFPEGYVALCVIVKDQAADLREWLQYHRWIGISRVYLFDNNSTVREAGSPACTACYKTQQQRKCVC